MLLRHPKKPMKAYAKFQKKRDCGLLEEPWVVPRMGTESKRVGRHVGSETVQVHSSQVIQGLSNPATWST